MFSPSSDTLNTICMPRYFILQTGFAERILKEKSLKISWNYMRCQPKTGILLGGVSFNALYFTLIVVKTIYNIL